MLKAALGVMLTNCVLIVVPPVLVRLKTRVTGWALVTTVPKSILAGWERSVVLPTVAEDDWDGVGVTPLHAASRNEQNNNNSGRNVW
jgi:hypothetical protein